jgi:hypothetical protein
VRVPTDATVDNRNRNLEHFTAFPPTPGRAPGLVYTTGSRRRWRVPPEKINLNVGARNQNPRNCGGKRDVQGMPAQSIITAGFIAATPGATLLLTYRPERPLGSATLTRRRSMSSSGSHATRRWRKQDSNHRSRVTRPIFQCRRWSVPRQPKSRSGKRTDTRSSGPSPADGAYLHRGVTRLKGTTWAALHMTEILAAFVSVVCALARHHGEETHAGCARLHLPYELPVR